MTRDTPDGLCRRHLNHGLLCVSPRYLRNNWGQLLSVSICAHIPQNTEHVCSRAVSRSHVGELVMPAATFEGALAAAVAAAFVSPPPADFSAWAS